MRSGSITGSSRINKKSTFIAILGWITSEGIGQSMREALGVAQHDDLYEVAGCMLRLAFWPTNKL